MYTVSGRTAFFETLLEIDLGLARITKSRGCPACGGILDVRNFPRKPGLVPATVRVDRELGLHLGCLSA